MKNGKYPLVLVKWQDSARAARGAAIEDVLKEGTTMQCLSVGWLIQENADRLIVAAQLDGGEECGLRVTIPRVCVKTITHLRARGKKVEVTNDLGK